MEKEYKYPLILLILSTLYFLPFLGGVHLFDWDEINFAELAREMIVRDNYLQMTIDFQPFYQKPPLFIWLQVLCMKLFGINEFAARLPNALCGILTLQLLYLMGKKLYDVRFGLIWAGAYFGSVLPHLYFRSGIIDPWFNLLIFLGLYFFILAFWHKEKLTDIALTRSRWSYLFFGGLLLGMAILTKGPVAYLIVALVMGVYWIGEKFRMYLSIGEFLFYSLAASLVTLIWFGAETLKNGPTFVLEFTRYQYVLFSTPDAGHAGFPGYHFAILLIGCFPASVFALRAFFNRPAPQYAYQSDFGRWMKILFWVVVILFSVVQSKIVHYSSLCYFPITFLAAQTIDQLLDRKIRMAAWMKIATGLLAGIFALAAISLPIIGKNITWLQSHVQDEFAKANFEAEVSWSYWQSLPGWLLLLVAGLFFFLWRKDRYFPAFKLLFLGTASFVFLTLIYDIRRIEAITQRAAIEFFKSKKGEEVYVKTYGYKSYAHLFYTRKEEPDFGYSHNIDWLLNESIDKDAFIVCRINRQKDLQKRKDLEKIGEKNGFVFFRRKATSQRGS